MGYTPYKMLGHELKGPNQKDPSPTTLKAFGTNDTEFLDQENTDAGTSPTNYGSAVGGSPNKLAGVVEPMPLPEAGAAPIEKTSAAGIPPHGDESHTGGAVGGEPEVAPEEAPWEVMKSGAFGDMKKGARKDYMAGLDKDQRKQQIRSNLKGGMFGGGIFGGGGGGGFGGGISSMFSDIRLKENIDRVGISESGIPIYEFNYIGDNNRYSGAMAQDLIEMDIDAVSMDDSGFYKVNYNNIDVDMHLIN